METQTSKINPTAPGTPQASETRTPQSGRMMGGLVIVAVGTVLLARQLGADIPGWLFSWPTLLIALGVYIGARHSFRDAGWIIPVAIGTFFLLDDFFYDVNITRFFWPAVIIGVGLFMIIKARTGFRKEVKWNNLPESVDKDDVLDCVTVFGGVKKNVISKNFRGGEAVTIFGGTDLNLLQAESPQPIVLELTQIFGGTKLIVPQHWKVHAEEMVTIFGGLNDKRPLNATNAADTQVVVIKGTCLFGGIDIKSF